jgi:hypothetical protein
MSNKNDRPENEFGHSPFNRDSYLSTQQLQASEGANTTHDHDPQEDIGIMSKPMLSEEDSQALQDELAEDDDAVDSDPSSVDDPDSDKQDE